VDTTILSDKAVVAERTIPNYRQQIRKALPDQVFKPDYKNLIWFPVHFSSLGFGFWALTNHFSYWTAPLIALVMGHSMGCMGFLAHDIMHGGSIKNLFVRDFLGGIGFSPFAISPLLWRKWHNADHHNNTQIKGVDPDHLFTIEEFKDNPVLKALYLLHPLLRNIVIFGSFTFRMTQQQLRMLVIYLRDRDTPVAEKFGMFAQMLVAATAWIALTWSLGPQVFVWGYVVALMVANALVISYIATNHFLNPLADERDVLATSLTVTLPKRLKWLDSWHQYFGAHVAHHLFPGASANNIRLIEAKAEELFPDRYHSMSIFRALQLLWQTPWIYEDNETLYDPVRDERTKTLGHGLKK
jgi:fatty acid desaturase